MTLKDNDYNVKFKDSITVRLMDSKEDVPVEPIEKPLLMEDMDEQLTTHFDLSAGLHNLGNTCYLNATMFKNCTRVTRNLKAFSR